MDGCQVGYNSKKYLNIILPDKKKKKYFRLAL